MIEKLIGACIAILVCVSILPAISSAVTSAGFTGYIATLVGLLPLLLVAGVIVVLFRETKGGF